jgi:hypothetical protein
MTKASPTTIRIGASLLSAAFLAAVTVGMTGCGPSGLAPGVVSGKVTYNGTPLTGGNIILHPVNGGADVSIGISNEGTFTSSGIAEGEMQVSIETESLKGKAAPGYNTPPKGPKPPAGVGGDAKVPEFDNSKQPTYMKIPSKYASVKTSGLTWTITKGTNNKDFELTDN